MAKRRIQPDDQEIGRRSRHLARQLRGRVYAGPDNVYIVRGRPDFEQLLFTLNRIKEIPSPNLAPRPLDLGFSTNQITNVSRKGLATRGRALQKWRKILEDYDQPDKKKTKDRKKYKKWRSEISELSSALEQLWMIIRVREQKRPFNNSPYLPPVNQTSFEESIVEMLPDPLWRWMGRLVIWIAGPDAGDRFYRSVYRPGKFETWVMGDIGGEGRYKSVHQSTAISFRDSLLLAIDELRVLDRQEQMPVSRGMADAVQDVLDNVPEQIREMASIKLPRRPRDVNISKIIESCEIAIKLLNPPEALIAAAAALCATDDSDVRIPSFLVSPGDGPSIRERKGIFCSLHKQCSNPGYPLLLRELGNMEQIRGILLGTKHKPMILEVVRKFLVSEIEIEEIEWIVSRFGIKPWMGEHLIKMAGKGLSPRGLRLFVTILEDAGLEFEDRQNDELEEVLGKIVTRGNTDILDSFADWVSMLDRSALEGDLASWCWNCFYKILFLEKSDVRFTRMINKWCDPPLEAEKQRIPDYISEEARDWLRKFAGYQRISGVEVRLTKGLKSLLFRKEKLRGQIEYLSGLRNRGKISKRQALRLESLELKSELEKLAGDSKLISKTQKLCARTALEAISHMAADECRIIWRKYLGEHPPDDLSEDHVISIAAWFTGLSSKFLKPVKRLLRAWSQNGADYRGLLPENREWIAEAVSHGISMEEWFNPEPFELVMGKRRIEFRIAPTPFHTFLMGNYFGTCLSLNSWNWDSVISNAYDANKAVLFALDSQGNVLARKLICVSTGFEMLGFRTYVFKDKFLNDRRREKIKSIMDVYCGKWARRAKIPLAYRGNVAEVSGLPWYDDGICRWLPEAMHVYRGSGISILKAIRISRNFLLGPVIDALKEKASECKVLLEDMAICPEEVESGEDLSRFPALAEEVLAIIARRDNDRELAETLYQNAVSRSGQLEAMTSLALIEGDEFIGQLINQEQLDEYREERILEVLYRMDTPASQAAFMKKALNFCGKSYRSQDIWMTLFAGRSKSSWDEFVRSFLREGSCYNPFGRYLKLIIETILDNNWNVPDSLIKKLTAEESVYIASFFCSFMPPLSGGIEESLLKELEQGNEESNNRMGTENAIVMALRNPGPVATSYLREKAETDPSALLALSIQSSRRYREFIRKRALAAPDRPASILALMISEGAEEGLKMIGPVLDGKAGRTDLHIRLSDMFTSIEKQDFDSANKLLSSLNVKDCFPFFINLVWEITDPENPDINAIDLLSECHGISLLWKYGRPDGVAARLARLLKHTDAENERILREALIRLIDNELMIDEKVYFFLLDRFSGYRLMIDQPDRYSQYIPAGEIITSSAACRLLFNDSGEPHRMVEYLRWKEVYKCSFPLDLEEASRFAEFLINKGEWEDPVKELKPDTEIQKRLLMRYWDE